jgi:natural product biosynthesis luciferase-like monooxygenase protein
MRFGVHYNPTYVPELDGPVPEFYRRMFEQIELVDELGFCDAWVTEHHFNEYGGTLPHPPTFLAAAARTTHRVRLGVAISVLPLHNPLQVAEEYAMVDAISNGRLEFGVGRGSTSREFEEFRIDATDSAVRMREAADIIRRAWTEDALTFHGEVFDYDEVRVLPKPVQQPHPPFWVGASRSDDTFRWAGQNGFHLMTLPYMYEPAVLKHWLDVYRDELTAAGYDPASREILGKFHIYVAETNAAVEEARPYLARYETIAHARTGHGTSGGVAPPINRRQRNNLATEIETGNVIAGTPERCIEIIQRWRDTLGLTTISGTFYFGGLPQAMALRNLRLFAEQVMPAFQGGARDGAQPASAGAARVSLH